VRQATSVADARLARRLILDELFDLSLYKSLRTFARGDLARVLDETEIPYVVLDLDGDFARRCNRQMVDLDALDDSADVGFVGDLIDRHVAHIEAGSSAEDAPTQLHLKLLLHGFLCQTIAKNGNLEPGAQTHQALNVIGVLVREQNPVQSFRRPANERQSLSNLAATQTGIDEQPGLIGFEIGTVSAGTAPQNS